MKRQLLSCFAVALFTELINSLWRWERAPMDTIDVYYEGLSWLTKQIV